MSEACSAREIDLHPMSTLLSTFMNGIICLSLVSACCRLSAEHRFATVMVWPPVEGQEFSVDGTNYISHQMWLLWVTGQFTLTKHMDSKTFEYNGNPDSSRCK